MPKTIHRQAFESGAPARTRTLDQLIKSQLLYQLSYRGNQGRLALQSNAGVVNLHLGVCYRAVFAAASGALISKSQSPGAGGRNSKRFEPGTDAACAGCV